MTESVLSTTSPYYLGCAEIEWRDGNIPTARHYQDIYFSPSEGLQESQYVFLQHNRLIERWQALNSKQPGHFSIAETGFGTGLNFLASWQLWQQLASDSWQLHFISAEKHPLRLSDLKRSLSTWPELAHLAAQLITAYPTLLPGHHLLTFDRGRVNLHLLLGDATPCFEQLKATSHPALSTYGPKVDAWFLDGFAPSKNPQLWKDELFEQIAQLSQPGTTLATFSVAGHVRRALINRGFEVEKVPGFGQKREMLRGTFIQPLSITQPAVRTVNTHSTPIRQRSRTTTAPWYVSPSTISTDKHAVIIGAGLAGISSAYALAKRGWHVTVIERRAKVAQEASGNSQGMLYTKLSPSPGTLNRFALSSYLYALRFYRQLICQQQLPAHQYDFCGVLQLISSDKEQAHFQTLQQQLATQTQLVQFADAEKASRLSGVQLDTPAYYFPNAGWISPPVLCRQLSDHSQINTLFHSEVISLQHHDADTSDGRNCWHLYGNNRQLLAQADTVIIANSVDACKFEHSQHLPLKPIRGQISQIIAKGQLSGLRCIVCHDGYITPAVNGKNTVGATFDIGDSNTDVKSRDHQRNLDSLYRAIPSLLTPEIMTDLLTTSTGRAGVRCASPDYLPVVGRLPNYQAFLNNYAHLRKDASWPIATPGSYHCGLYINVGHGSKGLTSTPLCSELLGAIINNEPLPLPRDLVKALNPARFIIRDLIKNRI